MADLFVQTLGIFINQIKNTFFAFVSALKDFYFFRRSGLEKHGVEAVEVTDRWQGHSGVRPRQGAPMVVTCGHLHGRVAGCPLDELSRFLVH